MVDSDEVAVDVMVEEYCDVGLTVVDSDGNAVVVISDVGNDVVLSEIESS